MLSWKDHDEGPRPNVLPSEEEWDTKTPDITNLMFDHLKIDEAGRTALESGMPPAEASSFLNDAGAFKKPMKNFEVKDEDGNVTINLNDGWNRVFHPKGTALDVMADGFFSAIVNARGWRFDKSDAPTDAEEPEKPPQPPA